MSHDGCHEVAWKGVAFPFLMHHPNSFLKTENYGSARQAEGHGHGHSSHSYGSSAPSPSQQGGSDVHAHAGTGTWNGAAPRGYLEPGQTPEQAAAEKDAAAARIIREPETVWLSNGTKLPLLGFGTAGITSPDTIKRALELGYRHFDCASKYGNEAVVGEGLAGTNRADLYIVSKLWNDDHRPERVRAACEKTLSDLKCSYLDLYLVHWPDAWVPGADNDLLGTVHPDTSVTLLDTWRAMEALVDAGLVKAIGVCNFSVAQVEEVLAGARIKPVVNQVELHPLLPQRKLTGVCFRKGVQCVAFSPLGGADYFTKNTLLSHPVVAQVAKEAGKSPAQVLLRWNMQRGVPVIPKASSPDHIADNIQGAFAWRLSNAHKVLLDTLESNTRFICPTWHDWGNPEEGGVIKPSRVIAGEVAPPVTA